MVRKAFGAYLRNRGLAETTIRDYCTYVAAFERDFKKLADEIVRSDEAMTDALHRMSDVLNVSPNSFSSYARGLRMYYAYKHNHQYEVAVGRPNPAHPNANEMHWYKEIRVSDINEWWCFLRKMSRCAERSGGNLRNASICDPRCWAFRGQGDAAWELESSLGRLASYGEADQNEIGLRLRRYEQESMWTFKREASKKMEYRGLKSSNLLALMQHYGCKTRLLDFTMAPLVALYMALDQMDDLMAQVKGYAKVHPETVAGPLAIPQLALWAINLNSLSPKYSSEAREQTVADLAAEADQILDSKNEAEKFGVIPLFPASCNERISAQEGLFLMPRSLKQSFVENLQANIGEEEMPTSDLRDIGDETNAAVYKFVFDTSLTAEIRNLLLDANVTAKNIYPDLTGLGRFVSSEMMRHEGR